MPIDILPFKLNVYAVSNERCQQWQLGSLSTLAVVVLKSSSGLGLFISSPATNQSSMCNWVKPSFSNNGWSKVTLHIDSGNGFHLWTTLKPDWKVKELRCTALISMVWYSEFESICVGICGNSIVHHLYVIPWWGTCAKFILPYILFELEIEDDPLVQKIKLCVLSYAIFALLFPLT